jgi:hypothetical protein
VRPATARWAITRQETTGRWLGHPQLGLIVSARTRGKVCEAGIQGDLPGSWSCF